jgi:hypothetical protein
MPKTVIKEREPKAAQPSKIATVKPVNRGRDLQESAESFNDFVPVRDTKP